MFRELPKPEEIGDYEPYLTLNHSTQINTKPDEEIDEKIVFKF